MTRRAFVQYLSVCLLLAAQQGALMHAVWHAFEAHQAQAHAQEAEYQADNDGAPNQAALCVFDLAFGQVLGGSHGVAVPLAFVPAVVERIHDIATPRLHAAALSPRSRGPPVFL